tara:strand:- start:476 stop:1081 length:606 start_codon:yes stop_codon:yes gene_type:complete
VSTIKVNEVQHLGGGSALTIDGTGYITTGQPVLAKLAMTSHQTDLTDETYNKLKLDSAVIDTKSGFNNGNDNYVIPIAGYYRIYAQAHIGVINEAGSVRDTAMVITRTRSSTETQIAFSHNRLKDSGQDDVDDVMEQVYTIDECQAGDIITVYTYGNSDTDTAYDVFADVDSNDNAHMNTGLPGSGGGEDTITYVIIERII